MQRVCSHLQLVWLSPDKRALYQRNNLLLHVFDTIGLSRLAKMNEADLDFFLQYNFELIEPMREKMG